MFGQQWGGHDGLGDAELQRADKNNGGKHY